MMMEQKPISLFQREVLNVDTRPKMNQTFRFLYKIFVRFIDYLALQSDFIKVLKCHGGPS